VLFEQLCRENAVTQLLLRGALPAGSPPAAPALPRAGGRIRLPADTAVEVDQLVWRDGVVRLASRDYKVHPDLVRQRITLRLDGHLAHAIAGGQLVGTWPCPVPAEQLPALRGARAASSPLPPLQPTGPPRAQRRVGTDGVIMGAPPGTRTPNPLIKRRRNNLLCCAPQCH
jgi:hypothetical protein